MLIRSSSNASLRPLRTLRLSLNAEGAEESENGLQGQANDRRSGHDAERLDLQLARVQVVAEARDQRISLKAILRQQRQQMTARRFFRQARVGHRQPFSLGVIRDEAFADAA